MSIVLALLAALGFGTADFLGGLASRRLDFRIVTAIAEALALLAALLIVLLVPGDGLTGPVLLWGAFAGVGNGIGAMLLYHGLSVGRMSVVATLSGLTASVLPVLFGLVQGDSLTALAAVGIAIALPAIALVSWQPAEEPGGPAGGPGPSGAVWGLLAGVCFSAFYIGLDRAGTDSGAWPTAVNQAVALLVAAPFAARVLIARRPRLPRPAVVLALWDGVAVGVTTLALLVAFGSGELAIVVVLASLYPGVTTLLARFVLAEHWVLTQKLGLLVALAAIVLVSAGSG